jgi:hypothetical protein
LQPRDVRLGRNEVPPSARVAHRVWSTADLAAAKRALAEAKAEAEAAAEAERRREAVRRAVLAEAARCKAEQDAADAAAAAIAKEEATSEAAAAQAVTPVGDASGADGAAEAGDGCEDSAPRASTGPRSSLDPPPLFGIDGDDSDDSGNDDNAEPPVSMVSMTWAPKSLYDDSDSGSDDDDDDDFQPRESMFQSGVVRTSIASNEESVDQVRDSASHGAVEQHEFDDL